MDETIADRIKELRKQRGISGEQLADLTGNFVTRSVLANLESGRKKDLRVDELIALAKALDVSATTLHPELARSKADWRDGYRAAVRDMQARLRELE